MLNISYFQNITLSHVHLLQYNFALPKDSGQKVRDIHFVLQMLMRL